MFAVLLKIHCLPPVLWNWIVLFKRPKWQWSHSKRHRSFKYLPQGTYPKTLSKFVRRRPKFKVWWILKPKWPPRKGHSRKPRGGQLARAKRAVKVFSRTGERVPGRVPGMLLLTDQFHDSSECLSIFCARSEASIYRAAFVVFLYEGV